MGMKDRSTEIKHGLPGHLLGPVPLQTGLESKVSPSHQALLQHLLQKEQMRQQKMLSSGKIVLRYFSGHCVTYCYITYGLTANATTLQHDIRRNLIRVFNIFFPRSKLHVVPPSVASGHEGSPVQQSAKTTKTQTLEQNPVGAAASEHIGPTCHPAATPALSGETETVPAAGPYK